VAGRARQAKACEVLGLSERCVQRWRLAGGGEDGRRGPHSRPEHALDEAEVAEVLEVVNSSRFCELSPAQIVAQLADEGRYLASESTFYRILQAHRLNTRRCRSRAPRARPKPVAIASGPNEVWTWDITYLPMPTRGSYSYLYLVLDLFSRKIVAWNVHEVESQELASELLTDAVVWEKAEETGLLLHSDNGAVMKGWMLQACLERLGVHRSFSRPRVSNDNAFAEASFRTLKYRPHYPRKPLETVQAWREWVEGFVDWYNNHHRHSGIGMVTPNQRHCQEDIAILEQRKQLYQQAYRNQPRRWSRGPRKWDRPRRVALTPAFAMEAT